MRNYENDDTSSPDEQVYLFLGDNGTLLTPRRFQNRYRTLFVLISRIRISNSDICPCVVILVSTISENGYRIQPLSEVLGSLVIYRRLQEEEKMEKAPPLKGNIVSGERYYAYWFLLYCNDLNARISQFPKESGGGCYLLPLDHPLCRRTAA